MAMRLRTPVSFSLAILLLLSIAVLAVGAGTDKDAASTERRLRIEEARAIVGVYEIRLHNAKVRAEQEDVKWANVNETFQHLEKAHSAGAVPDKAYRESKEQYDWWKVQDRIHDWQEAEAELAIATVRLRMVESGMQVYQASKP